MIGQSRHSPQPHAPARQRWIHTKHTSVHESAAARMTGNALAKLAPPRSLNVIARERLFVQLDKQRAHPVVWISGPPGCGKTTLIASYLESRPLNTMWYRVDGGDADPGAFFHYLGRACIQSGVTMPASLSEPASSHTAFSLGRAFFRELFSRLARPAIVVLDDYQGLAEDSALHDLLVEAAQEIPAGISVVIVSRDEPPAIFARLTANQALARVDWPELRLTAEETRAIVYATHPADENMVSALQRQCEGWVGGLVMTLSRIHSAGGASRHSEAEGRAAVFDYLVEEVLNRATPEEQGILLSSAFLPRMTPASVEAISGSPHAGQLLSGMLRRHLFISRDPGSPPSYKYFDLLRQFLLARARETYTGTRLQQLANHAASLMQADGETLEALALYALAMNWEAVTTLLLREASTLLAQDRGRALRERIDSLPVEHVASDPRLAYWHGASLIQGDPTQARLKLESAFAQLRHVGDEAGQMLAVSGIIEVLQRESPHLAALDPWIDVLEGLVERSVLLDCPQVQLQVGTAMLSGLIARKNDDAQLVASVQALTLLLDSPANADARLAAATVLMRYHTGNLDSDNAAAIARSAAGYAAPRDVTPFNRASWLVESACSLALQLDYAKALDALDEASELVSDSSLAPIRGRLAQVRHLVYLASGDHAAMRSHIEVMRSQLRPSRPFEMSVLQSALSDDARLRGRTAHAVAHARSAVEFADNSGCRQERLQARIRCAAMLVIAGLDDEAMVCLDAARTLVAHSMLRDLLLIEACLALRSQTPGPVGGLIERALYAASGEHPASTMFMIHPALMSKLCAEGLRLGVESECIGQLIRRHRLAPPSTDPQAWPWPVRIYTLGGFKVLRDEVQIRFKGKTQKRPLELLQALIAYGGTEVAVSTLAGALWPDAEGDAAYHALENALYRLRQLLGLPAAVTLCDGRLSLDPQHCWVDVWAFERGLAETSDTDTQSDPATDAIMALYRGHFLDQEGQSWALPMRERLRDKIVRHVRRLAQSYERTPVWSNAASVYQRGLELDNLAEDLYRGLMVCHRELGNHAEAIKVYRRCRELLSIVLGTRPTDETDSIYATLCRT